MAFRKNLDYLSSQIGSYSLKWERFSRLTQIGEVNVLFMYAKDIIRSDSKNAFYGKYSIHHVLDRLIYFRFVLLTTLQQIRSCFKYWAQQVIAKWRLLS